MKKQLPNNLHYEAARDVAHTVNCVYRSIDGIPPHFHQSIEITCLLRGRVDFYVNGEKFPLSAGEITFVPAYQTHYARMPQEGESTWAVVLIVPKTYYEEFLRETGNASYYFLGDKEKNRTIAARMQELADGIEGMGELLVRAYVNMIFGLIARDYEPERYKHPHDNLMREIISFIEEHAAEELSLDRLSKEFGYSKYYFSRLFNETFHCNLNSYINAVRARIVRERSGDEKKTKAILESGFNSLSTYYRTTKE